MVVGLFVVVVFVVFVVLVFVVVVVVVVVLRRLVVVVVVAAVVMVLAAVGGGAVLVDGAAGTVPVALVGASVVDVDVRRAASAPPASPSLQAAPTASTTAAVSRGASRPWDVTPP